ncbi:glycosyltransferase [Enterococcus faecium]|uniref:glycosyltransferase n=3 Tax=Enterococcus faecium TaxID=1352 RepID=UPI002DD6E024|nr:glycosyltransferase [Enterococcus faecium]
MKIAYICNMNLDADGAFGIKTKVFSQVKTLINNNIKTDLYYATYNEVKLVSNNSETILKEKTKKYQTNQKFFFSSISSYLNNDDYKAVYIRLDYFSIDLMKLLKDLKKNQLKIIIEIPTYPYKFEFIEKAKILFKEKKLVLFAKFLMVILQDSIIKNFSVNYIDRIVTYSNDKLIWNTKTINISNAIDTSVISKKRVDCKSNFSNINLIAVSTLNHWHGYDRLIKGLEDYNKKKNDTVVKLFIAGDGSEKSKYESLVKKLKLTDYVIFLGMLDKNELSKYYDLADVAVDSLGRHRVGVKYNSSLKGKEYLAKGLPVISGVKTDLDYIEDIDIYLRFPSDESHIDITKIVDFYIKLTDKYSSKKNLTDRIRTIAVERFDFDTAFEPVSQYFKNIMME